MLSFILKADHTRSRSKKERYRLEGGSINANTIIIRHPKPLTKSGAQALQQYHNMESCWRVGHILCHFLLTLALLTIPTCDAFRLRDLKNTIQHIPLKRVTPEGGFRYLGGANSYFDKELKELHEFRVRRSAEGSLRVHNHTKITEEFELKGDNHSVAFLHWAGKSSSVSSYVFHRN